MDRLDDTSTAENKYVKAQLEHDIQTQIELSKSGYSVDPDVLGDLARRIHSGNIRTDGDYEKERLDLVQAVTLGEGVNYMNKKSSVGRWQFIDQQRNRTDLPPLEQEKYIKDLIVANEKLTADLNRDFMGTADRVGVFGPNGLSPVNIQGSPQDMVSQLRVRDTQYGIAQTHYGLDLGTGMFSEQEVKAMGKQLNAMTTQQQLGVIAAGTEAFGPEAVGFFEQLGKDGDAGTFAIAGIAQSSGYQDRAATMLDGRKWRLTNGKDLTTLNSTLDVRILKELKNAYINQPDKYRAVVEATKDAYYGRRQSDMDLVDQTIDGDDFDAAIREATGGLWEHGGKLLPVPKYGMDLNTMPRWIEDTSYEHFKGNTPIGYQDSETFWNDVQAGRLTLEPFEQPGTYTVSKDGNPLPGSEVDEYGRRIPYLLKYDASAEKSVGWWNRTKDAVGSVLE